jgi:16S rRNA processing protein RimM
VRVVSGQAERWRNVERVVIAGRQGEADRILDVESAAAYRDRLVLKLRGVDDAGAGRALKGHRVLVPADEVPELPAGRYYAARLVGLEVEEGGSGLGTVVDVVETGGCDVLVVREPDGHEVFVPMTPAIIEEIREEEGRISVRLPEGLKTLNREGSER